MSTVRATRAATEQGWATPSTATPAGCSAAGQRRGRRSPATGSTGTRSSHPYAQSVTPAGSRPGWVRMRWRPSTTTPMRTSTSFSPRCCRTRRDRRGCGRLPRAWRVRRRAGAALPRGLPPARARTPAPRRSVHRGRGVPLAIELGARSVDHLEATGDEGVPALAKATSTACCSPRARSSSAARCRPARALVDAGAAVALATDFNPGSSFCESLPLVCALAATQLHLSPAEALAACTVNAAHVLGRAEQLGRIAPGYDADIVLLDAPDWRYLAYHLGGDVVTCGRRHRRWQPAGLRADAVEEAAPPPAEGAAARIGDVYVDAEGNEVDPRRPRTRSPRERTRQGSRRRTQRPPAAARSSRRRGAARKRGLIFAPLMFVTVYPARRATYDQQKFVQTLVLLAIFLPFSYFMDTMSVRARTSGASQRAARRRR